ncbi:hypothetical protein [Natronoglycomyces albus]|uniref:Uncharacterized protein n=1 Tax=Natronoglycomyces albus TaxID=2811108 RepID=A0A895XM70_9ACTN|nr:hypothetical protein [Natronoglycomyces albus]QSB06444.1 hypothetical protein JQS30_05960 [Natronoglycomyces albus]
MFKPLVVHTVRVKQRLLELVTRQGLHVVEVRLALPKPAEAGAAVGTLVAIVSKVDTNPELRALPVTAHLWPNAAWRDELEAQVVEFWQRVNASNQTRDDETNK